MEERCPACGAASAAQPCPKCGATPGKPAARRVPLEPPRADPLPQALWQTWRQATLTPRAFFAAVVGTRSLGWPLLYAVVCWLLLAAANALIQQPLLARIEPQLSYQGRVVIGFARTSPEAITVSFLVLPVLLAPLLCLWAGLLHVLLALVGGAAGGYAVTLRVLCYAAGSTALWLVPVVGPLLAAGWGGVLLVIGLARAHQTEPWRSAFAVLTPLVASALGLAALLFWAAAVLLRGTG
ncbi:MAG: hypothetical protein GX774_09755 [Armatimonadetes bacterium]|nr:hypothetical protein [Armatimonadota bacterium]